MSGTGLMVPRLIERKRDGGALSAAEWRALVSGYVADQLGHRTSLLIAAVLWVVGWVAYAVLTAVDLSMLHRSPREIASRWTVLSLYHVLGELQTWIFGFEVVLGRVWYSAGLLSGLTAVSLAIIYRRLWALHRT